MNGFIPLRIFLAILCFGLSSLAAQDVAGDEDFWHQLEARIQSTPAVRANFSERREHPLRKRPALFTGSLRFDSKLGLSLAYGGLFSSIRIIDHQGFLVRTGDDSDRTVPLREELEALHQLLIDVFSFDQNTLGEKFEITRSRQDNSWEMDLVPKDPTVRERIRKIELTGQGREIRTLTIDLGPNKDVAIKLSGHEYPDAFSESERKAYFR